MSVKCQKQTFCVAVNDAAIRSPPEAGAVYDAIDMPWAKLVGQIAQAYAK